MVMLQSHQVNKYKAIPNSKHRSSQKKRKSKGIRERSLRVKRESLDRSCVRHPRSSALTFGNAGNCGEYNCSTNSSIAMLCMQPWNLSHYIKLPN